MATRTSAPPGWRSSARLRSAAAPPTPSALLLVLRGVQALGGAAGLVAAFELLDGGRPGPGRRMWVAASVFGIAVGPALGGALTQAFSWRAIFLAQAPIVLPGLLVALQAARGEIVAPGRRPRPRPAHRPAAAPRRGRSGTALGLADRGHLPGRPAAGLGMEHRAARRGPGGQRAAGRRADLLPAAGRPRDSGDRGLPAGRGRRRLPRAAARPPPPGGRWSRRSSPGRGWAWPFRPSPGS